MRGLQNDGDCNMTIDPRQEWATPDDLWNVLDEEFKFQDTDPANPVIYPESLILTKFPLAF